MSTRTPWQKKDTNLRVISIDRDLPLQISILNRGLSTLVHHGFTRDA